VSDVSLGDGSGDEQDGSEGDQASGDAGKGLDVCCAVQCEICQGSSQVPARSIACVVVCALFVELHDACQTV
jgi:hypothetical protein